MHCIEHGDVRFYFNGTFSGDVVISRGDSTIAVPFSALRAIVAEQVRRERIVALESSGDEELLDGLKLQ